MVETNHVQLPGARLADGADVVARIDQETGGAVVEVGCPDAVDNPFGSADEKPAALAGCIGSRVVLHIVQHMPDDRDHSASIAMAIPIPPPMHSAATP